MYITQTPLAEYSGTYISEKSIVSVLIRPLFGINPGYKVYCR